MLRNSFNNQHICVTVPFMNAVKWINKLNLLSLAFNRIAVFQTNSIFSDSERTILCWKLYVQGRDFFFFLFFYWGIIALQNFVVFCQTSTWISHRYIYIYISLPFWTSFPSPSPSHPSRLIQHPCLSFLRHTGKFHWLSILHMVM